MKLEELGLKKDGKVTMEGWEAFSEILDNFQPYPEFCGIIPSPFGIFEKYMSKVVPACVEMVLLKDKKVYLTYRKDKHWEGYHFPGSYLDPRESLIQTCQRIANREVPGITILTAEIIGAIHGIESPRFVSLPLITLITFEDEPQGNIKGKWFAKMPKNIINGHETYWPLIKKYL